MTREQSCTKIKEAIENFQLGGAVIEEKPFGNGHINDTFLLIVEKEDDSHKKIILQRMNHEIFKNPVELMENISNVTSYLKGKIIENGGDAERETLNVIPDNQNRPYYKDTNNNYWRCYKFIEDASCYETVEKPEDFYNSALAFGNFQRMLAKYPAHTLHETIKGFHDTKARVEHFKKVVAEDKCGRAASVQKEIKFILSREKEAGILGQMQMEGELPLRVTHNDTKLNNIMIDNATGKAICVIDLDTVMPGLAVNDFGDSIRFGASTGAEDEQDLSKIWCDLELFELYTKGFVKGCSGSLTSTELETLPMGSKMMTYECGMRFLADYLEGDIYFRIHREHQNLDRCRTQLKLVADMEEKWDKMANIVGKYTSAKLK